MTYATNLFARRRWFDLVPDDDHLVVVSGYGSYSATGSVQDSDYVTAARTPDGRLVMAYVPEGQTIGVDMSKLAARVRARWYDPTNGTYRRVPGSPLTTPAPVGSRLPGTTARGTRTGSWC